MPKDQRSIAERRIEQMIANKIMATVSNQTKCAHCDEEIGYYSLVGITIKVDDLTWCDTVCHDDWMDAVDAEQKAKRNKGTEAGDGRN